MNKNLSHALAAVLAAGATSASADILHLDDVIIDGSLCVGFDCVNGESFGFDTIRLKENNLRIKAQDTSSTASFPSNDWQITFNDSTNGGQNKFSIDDIDGGRTPFTIEAGAPSHSLYVDDGGRVGFGTSTPVTDLHVKSGNTPTLRLEQDGSSGFTAQTWDVAGNEAGFFIRDATGGSQLPFRILPGADSNSLVIDGSNEVGIGDLSPDAKLDVENGDILVERTNNSANTFTTLQLKTSGSSNDGTWVLANNPANGAFVIDEAPLGSAPFKVKPGAVNNTLVVDSNGISITGSITQNSSVIHPDYVFEQDFALESIADHAQRMWQEKHLPSVPPAKYDEHGRNVVDLGATQIGMLKELEKAHIYIEQIDRKLGALSRQLAEKEERVAALEIELATLPTQSENSSASSHTGK